MNRVKLLGVYDAADEYLDWFLSGRGLDRPYFTPFTRELALQRSMKQAFIEGAVWMEFEPSDGPGKSWERK